MSEKANEPIVVHIGEEHTEVPGSFYCVFGVTVQDISAWSKEVKGPTWCSFGEPSFSGFMTKESANRIVESYNTALKRGIEIGKGE